MKKIKLNSINSRMMLSFSVIIFLFIIMGLLSYMSIQSTNENTEDMIDNHVNVLILEQSLSQNIVESTASISDYFYIGDDTYKEKFYRLQEEREGIVESLSHFSNFEQTESILAKYTQWERVIESAIVDFDDGYDFVAFGALERARPISEAITADMKEQAIYRENVINERGTEIVTSGDRLLVIQLVIGGIVILIVSLVAIFTSRSISKPIISIMKELYRLAKGDLVKREISVKSRNDEMVKLNESANHLHKQLRDMILQIRQISNVVSVHSEELKQSSNQINDTQKHVTVMMDELASGAEDQAVYANEIVALVHQFNQKIDEANQNGGRVQRRTNRVLNMTNEGKELVKLSTEQMYTINDTLKDSIEKMEGLHQHTKEISNVITSVQSVAEQTNLLSLNATIEAARAGEHGKGFAVVAQEVRKLSDEVSNLVGGTAHIISNVQTESNNVAESLQYSYGEVEKGMNQIEDTESKFNSIAVAIEEAVDSLSTIMNHLEEFAHDSKEMHAAVEKIASISEESVTGIEETTASAQESSGTMNELAISSDKLTDLVNELNGLVGKFKLQ